MNVDPARILPTSKAPVYHPIAPYSSPGVKTFGIFTPRSPVEWAQSVWQRVHPEPKKAMFVLQMKQQANLKEIADMPRSPERRQAAWDKLVSVATKSQTPLAKTLQSMKQEGLVEEYHGYALGNTMEIVAPAAKADAVELRLKEAGTYSLLERFNPEDAAPPPPPPKDKRPPSITEQTLVKHKNDGPKDTETFIQKGKDAWQLWQMNVNKLRDRGLDGSGVVVGVLDTGVDIDHPNLKHAWRGGDPSMSWLPRTEEDAKKHKVPIDDGAHGTHVAGLIAGNESRIHTGVAPKAKLMVGSMFRDSIIEAFDWFLAPGKGDFSAPTRDAKKGADIVSNSWGMVGADGEKYAKALVQPLKQLAQAGVVPVFAAGNSGPGFGTVSEPGLQQSVVTVAATKRDGTIADFSSRDKARRATSRLKPDIAAPGDGIPSSVPDGKIDDELAMVGMLDRMTGGAIRKLQPNYPLEGTGGDHWLLSGTSMATPLVSGSLALLLQKYPELDTEDIKAVLHRSAIDMGKRGPEPMYGYGRIDLPKALTEAGRLVRARRAEARAAAEAESTPKSSKRTITKR